MGEYAFSIYVKKALNVGISYEWGQIVIRFLCLQAHISISKYATGYNLFDIIKK